MDQAMKENWRDESDGRLQQQQKKKRVVDGGRWNGEVTLTHGVEDAERLKIGGRG
jgi:hypothetical protein